MLRMRAVYLGSEADDALGDMGHSDPAARGRCMAGMARRCTTIVGRRSQWLCREGGSCPAWQMHRLADASPKGGGWRGWNRGLVARPPTSAALTMGGRVVRQIVAGPGMLLLRSLPIMWSGISSRNQFPVGHKLRLFSANNYEESVVLQTGEEMNIAVRIFTIISNFVLLVLSTAPLLATLCLPTLASASMQALVGFSC